MGVGGGGGICCKARESARCSTSENASTSGSIPGDEQSIPGGGSIATSRFLFLDADGSIPGDESISDASLRIELPAVVGGVGGASV